MQKAPMWFVVVAVVALLWNLLGCFAVAMDFVMVNSGALNAEQQALVNARPLWTVLGSCIAVLAGAVGSLGLVLRRRWATPALFASLFGLVVQDVGFATMTRTVDLGTGVLVMQACVLMIAIGLLLLARLATARDWLR
jgi:hypothetical protein